MSPRVRRLSADAEAMRSEFAGHPYVDVEPVGAEPPDRYRVTYRVNGIRLGATGQPEHAGHHVATIYLPAAYPREKPYCTLDTPIFHPNFGVNVGDEICVGDYWTSSQTLPDIVAKIGEMLQFQVYNIKSPLNAVAARWTAENERIFPVGAVQMFQPRPETRVPDPSTVSSASLDWLPVAPVASAAPATQAAVVVEGPADSPWWTEAPATDDPTPVEDETTYVERLVRAADGTVIEADFVLTPQRLGIGVPLGSSVTWFELADLVSGDAVGPPDSEGRQVIELDFSSGTRLRASCAPTFIDALVGIVQQLGAGDDGRRPVPADNQGGV